MLGKITTYFKTRKALNLIAESYAEQMYTTVSCVLVSRTAHIKFKTITEELDSSDIKWLSPEAYDILTDLDLIEPDTSY